MLSNAFILAKFRFDTAENEPAKNLQNNYLQNVDNLLIFPILLRPASGLSKTGKWHPPPGPTARRGFDFPILLRPASGP